MWIHNFTQIKLTIDSFRLLNTIGLIILQDNFRFKSKFKYDLGKISD